VGVDLKIFPSQQSVTHRAKFRVATVSDLRIFGQLDDRLLEVQSDRQTSRSSTVTPYMDEITFALVLINRYMSAWREKA